MIADKGGYSVSDVTVLSYEKENKEGGTKKIPGEYLAAVCRACDVSPTWLLLEEGSRTQVPPDIRDDVLEQIRRQFSRLDAATQAAVDARGRKRVVETKRKQKRDGGQRKKGRGDGGG